MSDVSPSDAVGEIDAETAEEVADAAADHAAAEGASESVEASDMGGSDVSISDALMHTEPDLSVTRQAEKIGTDEGTAHFVVGVRKVLDSFGIGTDGGEGTPAVANFAFGAWSWFSDDSESEEQESDKIEMEPRGGRGG